MPQLYVDANFIPVSVAVAADPLRADSMGAVQWRPAGDVLADVPLFGAGPMQCDLACNEEMDDRWLADAMALVATRPELAQLALVCL